MLIKKNIISEKILGCFAQASKDGNLLIILISFLKQFITSSYGISGILQHVQGPQVYQFLSFQFQKYQL